MAFDLSGNNGLNNSINSRGSSNFQINSLNINAPIAYTDTGINSSNAANTYTSKTPIEIETMDFNESFVENNVVDEIINDWTFDGVSDRIKIEYAGSMQYGLVNGEVGGYQGSLFEKEERFLNDEIIHDIVEKYYENATLEDIDLLFYRLSVSGCGYVATINTFVEHYIGNEELFKKNFGYDLYTKTKDANGNEKIDFNTEYLILDYFLFCGSKEYEDIDGLLGNAQEQKQLEESGIDGSLNDNNFEKTGFSSISITYSPYIMSSFAMESILSSPDVNGLHLVSHEERYLDDGETISFDFVNQQLQDENKSIVVRGQNFTLYYPDDVDGNGKFDDIYDADVGAHAMSVIGTCSDDTSKVVVSSWGEVYVMDVSDISGYAVYEYGLWN